MLAFVSQTAPNAQHEQATHQQQHQPNQCDATVVGAGPGQCLRNRGKPEVSLEEDVPTGQDNTTIRGQTITRQLEISGRGIESRAG